MPYQVKVVVAAFAAITRLRDERANDVDAEPTDLTLFGRRVQIRCRETQRIKRLPVVDEIDRQPVVPPAERHGDGNYRAARPTTVRCRIGEKFFEYDEKPRPLVGGETVIVGERVGKGFEPFALRAIAA